MLRDQPDDIYAYGAAYFKALDEVIISFFSQILQTRNCGRELPLSSNEIWIVFYMIALKMADQPNFFIGLCIPMEPAR